MFDEFIDKVAELRKNNEPFAVATVVRRLAPSSGKTGDKAVINRYGELFGWVGGGCTRSIILKEAETALQEGKPRLVRITPDGAEEVGEGINAYRMTCHSGGTVDVYIEPVLPRPHLVVMGKSAIAQALVRLGKAMNYRVTALAPGAGIDTFEKVDELHTKLDLSSIRFTANTFLVVATQGEQDEAAMLQALAKERPYVAFVASRRKREAVFAFLAQSDVSDEQISRIHSPAGLDINAKTPEEVAVSILAQIIQVNRDEARSFHNFREERTLEQKPQLYTNPVCGIPVDMATAKHVLEYQGEKVYFCCDGCKVKFEEEPERYMQKV